MNLCYVLDLVISEASKLHTSVTNRQSVTSEPQPSTSFATAPGRTHEASTVSSSGQPPVKLPKLLAKYSRPPVTTVTTPATTPLSEYHKYLALCAERSQATRGDDDDLQDCLQFWQKHKKDLPILFHLAIKVHSVPATSAPIERVFSHGGIVMRPHRARMGHHTLSDIVFLKCNE